MLYTLKGLKTQNMPNNVVLLRTDLGGTGIERSVLTFSEGWSQLNSPQHLA